MNIQEPDNKPVYEILDTVTITKQHFDWLNHEVLRIGKLARQYSDQGDLLRAELKLLRHEKIHNLGQLGEAQAELTDLKSKADGFKAEVEELKKPAIIGGYNLSQYIRMANSETLEFDNGDIFADMTLPERIKYIVESHARLKAEVERLTKAGDAMLSEWASGDEKDAKNFLKALVIWNAAKEGKQS